MSPRWGSLPANIRSISCFNSGLNSPRQSVCSVSLRVLVILALHFGRYRWLLRQPRCHLTHVNKGIARHTAFLRGILKNFWKLCRTPPHRFRLETRDDQDKWHRESWGHTGLPHIDSAPYQVPCGEPPRPIDRKMNPCKGDRPLIRGLTAFGTAPLALADRANGDRHGHGADNGYPK